MLALPTRIDKQLARTIGHTCTKHTPVHMWLLGEKGLVPLLINKPVPKPAKVQGYKDELLLCCFFTKETEAQDSMNKLL